MTEFWIEDLSLELPRALVNGNYASPVICPICKGQQFTVEVTGGGYGIRSACWNERTYIGIRRAR